MKKFLFLILLLLTVSLDAVGQSQPLTAEVKKQTVEDLSKLLPERYAYKEIGEKLRGLLLQNLAAGKYESYQSPLDFSLAVTSDLRSLNSDRHLALDYNPQPATTNVLANTTTPTLTDAARAKQASDFNRQMNFGFRDARFFNGNVGYLKFDYFDAYPDYSSPVVDASFGFFKNSDALIIDLRDNGGGGSQMVGYIEGFFFKEKTLSGSSYNRLTDQTTEEFIVPQPKEKQLPEMDLYLLTSTSTVSAAEALAYHLKYLKGAKIIGERSAGAANPGRVTRLNDLFTAFIPNRYGSNVVTKTNWEGTGVPVDIACPAEDALRVARIEALKKLRQKATDSRQQKKFDNYILYLEKINGEKEPSEKLLRQYVGEYQGGRSVALKNGKLSYARVADAGGELHFISPDVFMLAEGDVTITFKRDKQNRIFKMEYQWSLSDTPTVAAKVK